MLTLWIQSCGSSPVTEHSKIQRCRPKLYWLCGSSPVTEHSKIQGCRPKLCWLCGSSPVTEHSKILITQFLSSFPPLSFSLCPNVIFTTWYPGTSVQYCPYCERLSQYHAQLQNSVSLILNFATKLLSKLHSTCWQLTADISADAGTDMGRKFQRWKGNYRYIFNMIVLSRYIIYLCNIHILIFIFLFFLFFFFCRLGMLNTELDKYIYSYIVKHLQHYTGRCHQAYTKLLKQWLSNWGPQTLYSLIQNKSSL
jgi:hypothetical protein